jgi:mono/diheme cytochrome c family protein
MRGLRFVLPAALLVFLAAAGILLLGPGFGLQSVVINGTSVPPVPSLDHERVARGAELYATNCGACHGPELQGASDWKRSLPDGSLPPPPHDSSGHTWHHPDGLLLEIIANGGGPALNSKMPAFQEKLTPDEMRSILEFIKSKWGRDAREFQWWITVTSGGE